MIFYALGFVTFVLIFGAWALGWEETTCLRCGTKLQERGYKGDRKFCPECKYEN